MKIDFTPNLQRAWVAAAVGVGTAVYSGIRAGKQKRDADRLAKQNPFPNQEVPQAVLENQQIAQQQANQGLPSEQYNQGVKNIGRNQATALAGAGERRGGLGLVGAIQQGSNDATGKLDVASSEVRMNNRKGLMVQNNQLGNWQNNVWDWNKRQKYIQNAAAVRGLLGASRANTNTAIDRIGAAGIGIAGSLSGNNNNWDSSNYNNATGDGQWA